MFFPLITDKRSALGTNRAISLVFSSISCLVFLIALVASASGQQTPDYQRQEQREEGRQGRREERPSGLRITDPVTYDGRDLLAQGSVEVSFSVYSDEIERVKVRVSNENLDASSKIEKIDPNKKENTITVSLFKGRNLIEIVGLRGKKLDRDFRAELEVVCNGKKCKSAEESTADSDDEEELKPPKKPKKPAAASEDGDDDAEKEEKPLVKITVPSDDAVFKDKTFIDSNIVIQKKSKVERLLIQVYAENTTINQGESLPITYGDDDSVTVTPQIKIGKGKNVIKAFNASKPTDEKAMAMVTVTCNGDDCGEETEQTGSSVNTRAIAGFEQAGASSASSETKPFLDLFFTGPLLDGKGALPRLATWGQIRFSTTPEQTAAAGAFPSTLVNQVTEKNTIDLVQSFDFLAGLEYRLGRSGFFPSLLPGIKQKIGIYAAGGGGAISPLTTKKESAQIFKVPSTDNGQFELFKQRFGEDAVNKKYIGFVFPERDRFLRQYYGGVRFKTYFFDDNYKVINSFPAILDVMFGQNEAVTGGTFKNDVTDLNGKVIGKKRSWVLRLDGFYPLPVKKLSFLYLYGTALMKLGGGGVHITTPLFLDTAPGDVLVTSNDVFVAPNLQLNRDYYKIGVGINLLDLKPKTKAKDQD